MVYVDDMKFPFKMGRNVGKMCHMYADTIEELHKMADTIGLKREWFQDKKRVPHYDVTLSKRALAIQNGAEPVKYPNHLREFIREKYYSK